MATVLIADEDWNWITEVSAVVEAMGHCVLHAISGQEAYDLALSNSPDAIFLGIKLPIFDGFACCNLLRGDPAIPKELPVILCGAEMPNSRLLEQAGVTAFLGRQSGSVSIQDLLVSVLGDKAAR